VFQSSKKTHGNSAAKLRPKEVHHWLIAQTDPEEKPLETLRVQQLVNGFSTDHDNPQYIHIYIYTYIYIHIYIRICTYWVGYRKPLH
jgi:hypothetical protein